MGRYEAMMMPRAKKTGRWTSWAASRIFWMGVRGVVGVREMAHDVFDHDYGAVHHHAEIECAQRKEIGGNLAQVKTNGCEQECEGNGEGDNDCAADVAEEQKENDGDKNHALGEVVFDGFDRELYEVGAIEKGNDLDAPGEYAGVDFVAVEFVHLVVNALQDRVGGVSLLQKDDAFDGIRIVDDGAFAVLGVMPAPGRSGPAESWGLAGQCRDRRS